MYIPAKKYKAPPNGYVFKFGGEGQGFYKDGAATKLELNSILFPTSFKTAPVQLKLDELTMTKVEKPAKTTNMTAED